MLNVLHPKRKPSNVHNNKVAFTLAEVLITLGIIGVVAALTIPVLVQKHQKQVTVERLKSSYSILMQAIERAKVDYGTEPTLWQGTSNNSESFDLLYSMYFEPYIQTINKKNGTICKHYKCASTYKTLKGINMYQHDWSGSFYLKNGAFIHIHPFHCGIGQYSDAVYIDINGPEHGPNILGKDTFDFMLTIGRQRTEKNGILTNVYENSTRENLLNKCSKNFDGKNCGAMGATSSCGALIMQDGWQIKDDYPW